MGDYNPHAPQNLGQEWVPIREEGITFSPAVNVVEMGHRFTLTDSRTLATGRYYATPPPAETTSQVYSISVYPEGSQALTGPVRRVVIPCNAGAVSGTFLSGTSDIPESLYNPSDPYLIEVRPNADANSKALDLYFAVNSYANQLAGKRILGVNLLHTLLWNPQRFDDIAPASVDMDSTQVLGIRTSGLASASVWEFQRGYNEGGPRILAMNPTVNAPAEIRRVRFGEANRFWSTPISTTTEALPWRYEELQRFEQSAGSNRLSVYYEFGAASVWAGTFELGYAALEVLYCEETRVAVGGTRYTGALSGAYRNGANLITMRDLALAANPVLAAGDYVVTVSSPDIGDVLGPSTGTYAILAAANSYPTLNGIRELYELPTHTGVQVNVTQVEGEQFTTEETHVLPQLSLHTSGGPLTEVHVYGRQAVAQVYGSITATQEIDDGAAGGSYEYPWVRFYARRWGDTTVDLTLDSPDIGGSSVTITPTEFDALDEILDGWKEVTLRFDTPPTMGSGTQPQWRWSASGEAAGSRWEILGASAPAVSGIPGNLMNLVPSPNQLSIATYGQPVSGASINLGWVPQYAPAVTATADDQTSDAVIIFAQDMPAVTGFAVAVATQSLTGVGLNCDLTPCAMADGLFYHELTWVATSDGAVDEASFGYYELQRMDTVDTDWATIMKGTAISGASFNDYEARVGVESSYRIRAVDHYEFPGPWSDTVTSTLTSPGLTGGSCLDDGHILMFTTNERQDGSSNLGYSAAWEGQVAEDTTFPEPQFVQLQAMYNRDFFTAFRPTERGGEQFNRTLLVQAAAIAAPTLDGFQSLRDMAWDNVSYICVRDEGGNRWLATVLVPAGRVRFNRRLFLAEVRVIEVTATPSEVDPWS